MKKIEGCRIDTLDDNMCRNVLNWILANEEKAPIDGNYRWLLAHCHDGVTWGRFDKDESSDGQWQLSSKVFPELSPSISMDNLLELRIFGLISEIFLWRNENALSGRRIEDDSMIHGDSPTQPACETLVLLGDRIVGSTANGFTCAANASGAEQAIPLTCENAVFRGRGKDQKKRWPLRLKLRNYFNQDQNTGMVRIVASRLVDIYLKRESQR